MDAGTPRSTRPRPAIAKAARASFASHNRPCALTIMVLHIPCFATCVFSCLRICFSCAFVHRSCVVGAVICASSLVAGVCVCVRIGAGSCQLVMITASCHDLGALTSCWMQHYQRLLTSHDAAVAFDVKCMPMIPMSIHCCTCMSVHACMHACMHT